MPYKAIIFDMDGIGFIDASGIHELEVVYEDFKSSGIQFYFCSLSPQPSKAIIHSHLKTLLKEDSVHKNLPELLRHLNTSWM